MHQQASFGLKFRRSTYQQILESGTFAFKLPKHRTQLCEDLNHISRVTETRFNIVTRRLISNYINRRDVGETGDIISDIFTTLRDQRWLEWCCVTTTLYIFVHSLQTQVKIGLMRLH